MEQHGYGSYTNIGVDFSVVRKKNVARTVHIDSDDTAA